MVLFSEIITIGTIFYFHRVLIFDFIFQGFSDDSFAITQSVGAYDQTVTTGKLSRFCVYLRTERY